MLTELDIEAVVEQRRHEGFHLLRAVLLKARGGSEETLETIRHCGIDLDGWLEGFKDTPESVRKTVNTIKTHPLVPKDVVVRGFIIDSETGELEEVAF